MRDDYEYDRRKESGERLDRLARPYPARTRTGMIMDTPEREQAMNLSRYWWWWLALGAMLGTFLGYLIAS